MEQHPIPQNISSYQFRLVGDMTLKQFFQLAGGIVMGLIFYSIPVIGIVKWPFVIVSVLLGAGLAFVPLEERPMEKWIFAFFRAIYTPTEFFWKKSVAHPKFFQDETTGMLTTVAESKSAKQSSSPLSKLEQAETGFMNSISGIFAGVGAAAVTTTSPTQPTVMQIPQTMPTKIIPETPQHLVVEERDKSQVSPINSAVSQNVSPIIAGNEVISTRQAIFSVDAAPPSPPIAANVVVGQVVDQDRKIVEGAIMEIKDSEGRPIRALRSNKAGHFVTVTPLDNGKYEISSEKDGFEFAPVSFNANGDMIPPILVQGRRLVPDIAPVENVVVPSYMPN